MLESRIHNSLCQNRSCGFNKMEGLIYHGLLRGRPSNQRKRLVSEADSRARHVTLAAFDLFVF